MAKQELEFPEVIDNSLMTALKKCPALCRMEYLEHWKLQGTKVDLHAGAAFAAGVETVRRCYWEKDLSPEDSLALGLRELIKRYGDYECPQSSPKSLERMGGALEYYYNVAHPLATDPAVPTIFADGKRGIEFSFAEPIDFVHPVTGNPIIYAGRADAICDFNEAIYITDEKTTKQFGDTWANQWKNSAQFTGYVWAARRAGIDAHGVLVRGIKILKTEYDHRDALTYRSDFEIDRWYNELIEHLTLMQAAWHKYNAGSKVSFYYNLGDACSSYGGCAFQDVCKSNNPEPWLRASFERRKWDPVTRTETLLPESRRLRFTVEFTADIPGEYTLDDMRRVLEANPPLVMQEYGEGTFTSSVEPVPTIEAELGTIPVASAEVGALLAPVTFE